MRHSAIRGFAVSFFAVILTQPLVAQTIPGEALPSARGTSESVSAIMQRDRLQAVVPRTPREPKREYPSPPRQGSHPGAPAVSHWPSNIQGPASAFNPQTVGTNFLAMSLGQSGYIPPDSMGAVGPTQILAIANGRIRVFNKSGVIGSLDTTTNNFFASVGGNSSGTSDPHVRYDRLSGRWFVCIITVTTPNQMLMAVSSGSTITDASSFTFFAFTAPMSPANLADYPTLGIDKFALYIGVNEFNLTNGQFVRCSAFVVNKANLISGTLRVTAFRGVGTSTGIWTPQGVDNDDPAATEGYFVGTDIAVFSSLGILRVNNPSTNPSLSAQMNVTVPTTYATYGMDQDQPSSYATLDGLDDRLFAAQLQTNTFTGARTLWTAHNILVDASGVGGSGGDRNGSRWYEIGNLTTTPTLVQAGTLFDSASSAPFGFWIPSVAASRQGHMALGCSRASTNANGGYASVAVAGRLRGDMLGLTQTPTLVQGSTYVYDVGNDTPRRWGDYSQTVVDPVDGQTMWTFQEYASSTNTWALRVVQLVAPPPAVPGIANPSVVAPGQPSVDVVITGATAAGSEFFDPGPDSGGPGFPNRIAASFTGGIVVNSITVNSSTQLTLNISTVNAAAGPQNLTVTNPDGQSKTGNGILTICATPAPTITVGGETAFCTGGSVTLTSSSAAGNQWFRDGYLIAGATDPTYLATASGNYTVSATVSGCTSPTSAPVTVTVNPIPAMPVISSAQSVPVGGTGTASVTNHAGSTYAWTLTGGAITSGQGASSIQFTAAAPGTLMNLSVIESSAAGCVSQPATKRTMTDFLDVPASHPFHNFVVKIALKGISAGCGGGNFCPDNAVPRSQMAVFLLRGEHGESYAPPPATGIFTDVPIGSFAANYIEQLYSEGITSGCGSNPPRFCPNDLVLRSQMSVFLLRAEHGSAYVPPSAIGIFSDVPVGSFAANWIERLYNENITGGCGTSPLRFCPNDPNTRGQMAVFLTKTFGLP